MWTLRRMMMGVRFSLQMWICQIPMPMHRASGKEKESGYVWCVGDIVVVIVAVIVSLSVPPSSVGHEEKNLISLPPGPWGPGWYALRLTSHTIHIHLCPNTGWSSVSDTLQKVFWTGLHYYYYCRRRGIPTSVTAPICFYLWTWETYPWSDGSSHTYDASDDPMQRRFLHLNRLVPSVHGNQAPGYISMIQSSMRWELVASSHCHPAPVRLWPSSGPRDRRP